ncbi:MAG: hypothetical protein JWN94_3059 [Betaproteobacteria bacterium]|jgi:hypothetical protein|nr:hypothetical protein [Betaproteobacteria bacterium]
MTTKPTSSRRKFLATLGAGSAAAATVVLTRQSSEPAAMGETVTGQGKGYQLTEHVRNYYRSTKV